MSREECIHVGIKLRVTNDRFDIHNVDRRELHLEIWCPRCDAQFDMLDADGEPVGAVIDVGLRALERKADGR